MRVGELAHSAGVTPSAIRFYERIGLLPEPARTPSGYRDYDTDILGRLAFIQAGQAIGLTLAELGEVIAFREQGTAPCSHVIDLIEAHERQIAERISELRSLQYELRQLSERARDLDPAACTPAGVCHVVPATRSAGRTRKRGRVTG
ncbi:MAG: heavy metal-responsive transcriptional regulator [Nocardioidaceae bacterium]